MDMVLQAATGHSDQVHKVHAVHQVHAVCFFHTTARASALTRNPSPRREREAGDHGEDDPAGHYRALDGA